MLGLRLIRVAGTSMGKDVPEGSFALFSRWSAPVPGDVVLVKHPRYGLVVKELVSLTRNSLRLRGRAPMSVSEEQLGTLTPCALLGRMIWRG